jgi:hypothetical protein
VSGRVRWAVALLALVASPTAFAGGGGAYFDIQAGAGWSDATGPLVRGKSGNSSLGAYWGDYHGTFRYGRYWRTGVWSRYNENDRDVLTDTTWSAGVELGRGVDLLNVGVWWLVGVGPMWTDPLAEAPITWGGAVRGAVGMSYNCTKWWSLTFRVEGGAQFLEDHVSMAGGFGIGVLFRSHSVRTGWSKHDKEQAVVDVNFSDLFAPEDQPKRDTPREPAPEQETPPAP